MLAAPAAVIELPSVATSLTVDDDEVSGGDRRSIFSAQRRWFSL